MRWFAMVWVCLLLISGVIFLGTTLLPLWITPPPRVITGELDQDALVGLVSLVVAVLTLGGGAVYVMLGNEVRSQVRREIEGPLQVANNLSFSMSFYLEYSKALLDANYKIENLPKPAGNRRIREVVSAAVAFANEAYERSRLLPKAEYERLKLDTINNLTYHLATRYLLLKEESDRLRAITLAEQLNDYPDRENYAETVAWVRMNCPGDGTSDFADGQNIVSRLITSRRGSPEWRYLLHLKYRNLFPGMRLPDPRG